MRVRTFHADSIAAALSDVREEMGDAAHLLDTRRLPGGGVEVLAGMPRKQHPGSLDRVRRTLRAAGLDDAMTDELSREIAASSPGVESLERRTLVALSRRIVAARPARPGRRVVALVGPAGAGKTPTWAKLAARDALVHGHDVVLVTADTLRIGGLSQAGTYAELLDLELHAVSDLRDAHRVAMDTSRADRVYIDTPGIPPGQGRAVQTLSYLLRSLAPDETHLVLPAGTTPQVAAAIRERFAPLRPDRVALTRVDEAGPASLIPAALAAHLPLAYVTTGPTVPDDIEEITPQRLIERGLTSTRATGVNAVA
ncbi:MAG: hypothetical protein ACE5IK_04635 [Acidobacteriota bacterium]